MPLLENLYPNSGKPAKRVEIPSSTARKSLPKKRKSVERVENPSAAGCKSLPKQRKICRKGRESQFHRPEISTQTAENLPKR
ncbi:MAG TPA: hypothetical protein DCM21_05720 [Butyrivibrio sp.]|nr:hypothetical protein [Butyrivibrio sp.]